MLPADFSAIRVLPMLKVTGKSAYFRTELIRAPRVAKAIATILAIPEPVLHDAF
jgi:hypothetical protein